MENTILKTGTNVYSTFHTNPIIAKDNKNIT